MRQASAPASAALSDCRDMVELQRMFCNLQCSVKHAYKPEAFVRMFDIDPTVQQDVQEFWTKLVDHFAGVGARSDHLAPALRDVLAGVFRGERVNVSTCLTCEGCTRTPDVFFDLQVPIVGGGGTLEGCLAAMMLRDELKGDNKYFCERCGVKKDGTRHMELVALPPVLTLQLCSAVGNADMDVSHRRPCE